VLNLLKKKSSSDQLYTLLQKNNLKMASSVFDFALESYNEAQRATDKAIETGIISLIMNIKNDFYAVFQAVFII
jgi:hypothetical protein